MALTGDGYKIIADKFEADAVYVKLVGVAFPEDGDKLFRGVFNTRADLVAAYLANDETTGSFAFVKTGDSPDTSAGYYRVIVNVGGNKSWVRAEDTNVNDVKYHIANEVAWETFVGQVPTFTSTTITSALPSGDPLKLASALQYNIGSLPINTLGLMVQGIVFERETTPGEASSRVPFYYWGLGTNDWAGFTEPGEFVITSWDFKLGGFGG